MNPSLYQKWDLKVLNGEEITEKYLRPVYIEFNENESRISGSAACNRFFGSFKVSDKTLNLSQMGSTKMFCDDKSNQLETAFLKALGEVNGYKFDGQVLVLMNNKEEVARFEESNAVPDEMAGTWELFYITGRRIAFQGLYPDNKPSITLQAGSGDLTGNTSCNAFNATFNHKKGEKLFKPGAATLKACPGEGEQAFMEQFQRVDAYSVSGDTLTFMAAGIPNMKFLKTSN